MTHKDASRRERAAAPADQVLATGFRPRTSLGASGAGSGFESGGVLDVPEP